jgi:hypothetical protein
MQKNLSISSIMKSFSTNYIIMVLQATCGYYYGICTEKVKWDNHLSENIYVNQGIQQGAKLSTSLYKCYNYAILDSVTEGGLGSHLGTISVATPYIFRSNTHMSPVIPL